MRWFDKSVALLSLSIHVKQIDIPSFNAAVLIISIAGERYSCSQCDKTFLSQKTLDVHGSVHSNSGKEYKCPFRECRTKCSQKFILNKHVRTKHKKNNCGGKRIDEKYHSKPSPKRPIKSIQMSDLPKSFIQKKFEIPYGKFPQKGK